MRDSSLSPSSRLGGAVISDRIVSALLEELRTGRYAQTDRLPAEVDLAAELGVSRTVIRDALSEMERAGYIERVRLMLPDAFFKICWKASYSPCMSARKCSVPLGRFRMASKLMISVHAAPMSGTLWESSSNSLMSFRIFS